MATVDVNTRELSQCLSSIRQISNTLAVSNSNIQKSLCYQQLVSYFSEVAIPVLDVNIAELGEQVRYNLDLHLEKHLKNGHNAAIKKLRQQDLRH